jgi:DNA-binding NtrC family response regulator
MNPESKRRRNGPLSVSELRGPRYFQDTALIVHPKQKEREALQRFFSDSDYHVLVTRTGTDAIELCRAYEGAIHILVTDVDLPGTSGWKLAEAAAKVRPGLLVLFLSATGLAGRSIESIPKKPVSSAGSKPVTPPLLEVTRALAHAAALQR